MTQKVPVALNTFDDEGVVVDTSTMDLSIKQISDIVDHAAQLIIVERTSGEKGEAFQNVLNELESALVVSSVIADAD